MAFARGQLMQVVRAGEDAERCLNTKKLTPKEQKEMWRLIAQGERAKEILRDAGVNWV